LTTRLKKAARHEAGNAGKKRGGTHHTVEASSRYAGDRKRSTFRIQPNRDDGRVEDGGERRAPSSGSKKDEIQIAEGSEASLSKRGGTVLL